MRVQVMVVEMQDVVRAGLVARLSRELDLRVTGDFTSAEEALRAMADHAPDVIVMNDRLPGVGGAIACREFRQHRPEVAVLVLATNVTDDVLLHACLVAGARGYIARESDATEIVRAVRAIAHGESVLASEAVGSVIKWARRAHESQQGAEALTTPELLAVSFAAHGLTNRDIGRKMSLSDTTIKLHMRAAMRKLGATDRWQAVAAGIRRGII